MRHSQLLATTCFLSCLIGAARAENATTAGASAETAVTIVTAAGVAASVTFEGDYGPNRIEGSLVSLPEEPIRAREGKQVREIAVRHLQELQRTPLGVGADAASTYQLTLFSGESYIVQPEKSEPPTGAQPAGMPRTLQVVSVPKEEVELKTALFGVIRIPFPKLLQLTVQPIRGVLREAPQVSLALQVLPSMTLSVPFQRVTNFRRDPLGGTATVSFGVAEGVTGKISTMPAGNIVVRTSDGEERRIPLSEVVQYNLEGPTNVATEPASSGAAVRGEKGS